MIEVIQDKPFLIAIAAGSVAQAIKVLSFLLVEKRVNYRRFVQADGSPNMHSSAMTALTLAVGFKDGFTSLVFALSLCLAAIVMIDTMNVKGAASKQAEVIYKIMDRVRKRRSERQMGGGKHSYTLIDVLTGAVLGTVFTLLVF